MKTLSLRIGNRIPETLPISLDIMLEQIIKNKQQELIQSAPDGQKFIDTFMSARKQQTTKIIAEVKLASPQYDMSATVNPFDLIDYYGTHPDIAALSILIDTTYFKGDITRASYTKQYKKPILFKEFLIDTRQIDGAAYFGYDAVLLIKRCLEKKQLITLTQYAQSKHLCPLIEVDTPQDLEDVIAWCKELEKVWTFTWQQFVLWYNCRNLWTMAIDTRKHMHIYDTYKDLFDSHIMLALSWVDSREQAQEYHGLYHGILMGTSLVQAFAKNKSI